MQEPAEPCGYVVVEDWQYGQGSPFCDAPALPGRAYCARHWALCHRPDEAREAEPADTGGPPAELAHLEPVDLPEPGEPAEALAELALPAGAADDEV